MLCVSAVYVSKTTYRRILKFSGCCLLHSEGKYIKNQRREFIICDSKRLISIMSQKYFQKRRVSKNVFRVLVHSKLSNVPVTCKQMVWDTGFVFPTVIKIPCMQINLSVAKDQFKWLGSHTIF